MDKTRIIVVEDNIVYCEFVCNLLTREGFRTVQAFHLSTAKKLVQQAKENDIIVSDLRLPDGDGIDLLRWMRKDGMMQPFIIMTDYAEVHTAVESMKLGSLDYIPKQLVEDKLVPLLRSILKERHAGRSRMPVFSRDGSAFQAIMKRIRLVAPTDMSVLIFGENGTGKEHIAHLLQTRANGQESRLWLWTAVHSPKNLRHRRFSDTSEEHSRVLTVPRKDISMRRKAARCFWTRWAISLWKPSRCFCVRYRSGDTVLLVIRRIEVSTSASLPRPTRIWERRSMKSVSGRIYYTACMTLR